jgi:hypothetical protein
MQDIFLWALSYRRSLPAARRPTVDDMVLCRNNAPLIGFALRMLGERRPMRVLGDFGDKLISFIRSFKTEDINIFTSRLEEWRDSETARLTAREQWSKLAIVDDKYAAIQMIMKGCRSVEDIKSVLVKIFEQGHGPIISSIHKAKGMEADRYSYRS